MLIPSQNGQGPKQLPITKNKRTAGYSIFGTSFTDITVLWLVTHSALARRGQQCVSSHFNPMDIHKFLCSSVFNYRTPRNYGQKPSWTMYCIIQWDRVWAILGGPGQNWWRTDFSLYYYSCDYSLSLGLLCLFWMFLMC